MPGLLQNISLIGENLFWLQKLRAAGREAFAGQGIPTAKTEAWKYTKPRELKADDYVMDSHALSSVAAPAVELPFPAYRIHFDNGIFNPATSVLPDGVEVLPLIEAVLLRPDTPRYLGALVDLTNRPFAALNTAYLQEGVYIRVAKNVELKRPLVLINHTAAGENNLFYNLRNLIILESGAAAEFVEYYHYYGDLKSRYLVNVVNEIFLETGARLKHYKYQNEAFKANHLAFCAVEVKAAADYESFTLQKGANIGRNETLVRLREEKASAEVNAAYRMNGWATLDTATDIEHLAPCTYSSQLVKGVVGGDARGVFTGRIHIAPQAVQTEGRQLHKALLLSDTAEVDVKPELEIFADDVKCSHGAASGELDEEALFYMLSRGIAPETARQLLIDAYLDEALARISDQAVRRWFSELK